MSPVEAVARALWDHDKVESSPPEGDGWKLFVDEAQVAIEALAAHIHAQVMARFPGRVEIDDETWALTAGRELAAIRAALTAPPTRNEPDPSQ